MRYFVRCKDIVHPGKYFFKAKSKRQAAAMVKKEMEDFLKIATLDQLVVDISEDMRDLYEA